MSSKPIVAFHVLALAITWLAWFPAAAQSHGVGPFTSPVLANPVLYIVGGLGPRLAAVIVMRALHGEEGDQRLLAALRRWRVGVVWWVVAVFAFVAIELAAAGLGGELPPRERIDSAPRKRIASDREASPGQHAISARGW